MLKQISNNQSNMTMTKLMKIRIMLITLQLTSSIIASIILIIYYNAWITNIITEAERTGNTGQTLANQIRRTDNEQLVIFFMSTATILVSLLGIIGACRSYEHNHCLLNFYMSTLIIFLFVVFVALCGTIWEVFGKINRTTPPPISHHHQHNHTNMPITTTTTITPLIINTNSIHPINQSNDENTNPPYLTDLNVKTSSINNRNISFNNAQQPPSSSNNHHHISNNVINVTNSTVTWWYISKSFILIILSFTMYAIPLRLAKKILESSDDHYLSANECNSVDLDEQDDELNGCSDFDHCNGCATKMIGGYPHPLHHHHHHHHHHQHHQHQQQHNTDVYHQHQGHRHHNRGSSNGSNSGMAMIGSSKSSLGSQFRTIL